MMKEGCGHRSKTLKACKRNELTAQDWVVLDADFIKINPLGSISMFCGDNRFLVHNRKTHLYVLNL